MKLLAPKKNKITFRPDHTSESPGYRMCRTTVMDTTDPGIKFEANGDSHFVNYYKKRKKLEIREGENGKLIISNIVKSIKQKTKINCICGVSGGVDSSLVLLRAVQNGLKPLAVHVDNGWNNELAVENIEKITKKLDVELYTEVLNWELFRDFQKSFFKASVPNIEMITDHTIVATLFKVASNIGVNYILSGSNLSTEAFLPTNSGHDNKDWKHIRAIQKKFGEKKITKWNKLNSLEFLYMILVKKIKFIPFLNYLDYNRDEAKKELLDTCGWKDYGRKHGESLFTRFFQEYYLPKKFGIDKRRAHLSCQILAGQISRDEALNQLNKPLWEPGELEDIIRYVQLKLGFSEQEWQKILTAEPRSHENYPINWIFRYSEKAGYKLLRSIATDRHKL